MTLFYQKNITRADVQANFPRRIYLFGDNMQRVGRGGQAFAMRDEPNAVGLPTKWTPFNGNFAFFSDEEFQNNPSIKNSIDFATDMAFAWLAAGGEVVIPKDGIGTGFAQLETRAPAVLAYINDRLKKLEVFATEIKEI
jgi:hypothetical protein